MVLTSQVLEDGGEDPSTGAGWRGALADAKKGAGHSLVPGTWWVRDTQQCE